MKDEFVFMLQTGKEITLVAEYEEKMKDSKFSTDWGDVVGGKTPTQKGILTMYIDGEFFRESHSISVESSWRLIDTEKSFAERTGCTKYLDVFDVALKEDVAERYQKWIDQVVENGRDDEVREYYRKKKEVDIAKRIKMAEDYIKRAEIYLNRDGKLMTNAEYKAWAKGYNDTMNEGGEGFIPDMPTVEGYEDAKKHLLELTEERGVTR